MENILNNNELLILRKSMPKGYKAILAEKANCSESTVYFVFKNECKNLDTVETVISEALKIAVKRNAEKKAKAQDLRQKLQTIS
jgi:hypothetical protein